MAGNSFLPPWLAQQLASVPQSDPRNALMVAAQPIQSFGEGAGNVLMQFGRGLGDFVSLPRRVYEGTADPTGQEAAAFGVNLVPMAGMSLAVGEGLADTGRAIYSSRDGIANALMPSASAQDPYAAQKQQIDALRSELQRVERSNIGPKAKLESIKAINAQIQAANDALIQRQTGDANLERDNAAKQAEIRRQEEVAASAAAREKAKAEAPFRERQPEWSTAFNSMALAVPAMFGIRSGLRGARAATREANLLDDATAAEGRARQAFADGTGDAAAYARAQQDLAGQYKAFQDANQFKMSPMGMAAAGGTSAALAASPEILDLAMPQGTRAGDNARNQLTSGMFYGQKAALGLAGAGLYEGGAYLGSKLPKQPTPNTGRARALEAEGGPPTLQQIIDFERTAAETGGQVQSGMLRQRQQRALDGAAHQLELDALGGIDRGPLVAAAQRTLEARQGGNLPALPPPPAQPPAALSSGSSPGGPPVSQSQNLTIPRDVKPRAEWEPYSADARRAVISHVEGGGHLAPAKGASKDPGTLRAQDVHDQLNAPGFGVKNTQAAMKRLRDVVMANGVNPKTVTVNQIKSILDRLDPKIFGGTIAAGGAGSLATGQDY